MLAPLLHCTCMIAPSSGIVHLVNGREYYVLCCWQCQLSKADRMSISTFSLLSKHGKKAIWVNNATASHPVCLPVHRCRSSERSGRGHRRRRVPELRRGLALIHRDNVKFQKRAFDVDVTTFEYLYGYATTSCGQFVLLAVDRPGSEAVTATF